MITHLENVPIPITTGTARNKSGHMII